MQSLRKEKKVLFVDHQFHKTTRSSDFFIDILQNNFLVESCYLQPEAPADLGLLAAAGNADIIILWQMDFLAPLFLAMGKSVVVIPMFDGSGGMPNLHWLFSSKARFLNFCLSLNERIRMAGCETMLLRYFPEAVEENKLPRFNQLNAFLWQRRPDHGITYQVVDLMLGNELDSLHLHNVLDVTGVHMQKVLKNTRYKYSESNWFKNKVEYQKCIGRANVFIAPRVTEGIGMALLEAMAEGKLVLAHDAPTHNEYICNWVNGILFNKDQVSPISVVEQAARIAKMGWRTAVEGRKEWLASHSNIIKWVDEASAPPMISIDYVSFFKGLWESYYISLEAYMAFLNSNFSLLSQLCDKRLNDLLELIGNSQGEKDSVLEVARDFTLDSGQVLDLRREDNKFIGEGWSGAETEFRWAEGLRSKLYFSGLKATEGQVEVQFTALALPKFKGGIDCLIMLNEEPVGKVKIKPNWSDYFFRFNANLLKYENELFLAFDKAASLPTDSRVLSVCFKTFRFRMV